MPTIAEHDKSCFIASLLETGLKQRVRQRQDYGRRRACRQGIRWGDPASPFSLDRIAVGFFVPAIEREAERLVGVIDFNVRRSLAADGQCPST